ncbi:LOW QUALITY PROTEIN: low-density lipoprotein receptor-related protein 4-like [Liolophura sinensis]|uniref:LOW QUALITY PROTEIN: low-density lipoprotein receptor-related protein 4-like n=1 Tax=Liolophura sinensis TaxID=3198878 RepID=UPI003158AA45
MTADLMENIARFLLAAAFVVLLSVTCRGSANSGSCSSDERACSNGDCLYMKWWCDGEEDCLGGEDEVDCPDKGCSVLEFQCDNGHCIQDIFKCNGEDECGDLSDEQDCVDLSLVDECDEGQFMCEDRKRCIRDSWVCDLKSDCLDHSDESQTRCGPIHCTDTQFACRSGRQCIVGRWACDGRVDCDDGSDEECDKLNVCDEDHGWFLCGDQTCISIARLCDGNKDCPRGRMREIIVEQCVKMTPATTCALKLRLVRYASATLATCLSLTGRPVLISMNAIGCLRVCSQMCTNLAGSYLCSCWEGYRLEPDGHTCKVKEANPVLFYSEAHQVHSINLHTSEVKQLVSGRKNITDIAYDQVGTLGTLFWADQEESAVFKAHLDYPLRNHVLPVVNVGLSSPHAIAVDWLSAILYIMDSGCKEIIGCRMGGDSCTILVKLDESDLPLSIVVDPKNG